MAGSDSFRGAVLRGKQLLREKRYADALQVCTDELARGTDDPELRLIAAHALMAQGRHEGAKKEALQVIRLDPTQAEAHRILADVACTRGEHDAAKQHLQRALDLDPEDGKSRHLLETLTRPAAPVVTPPDGGPETTPFPRLLSVKGKAASLERFIESAPLELQPDDLEEDEEEEAVPREEETEVSSPSVASLMRAAAESAPLSPRDSHVDIFSGVSFSVAELAKEKERARETIRTPARFPSATA